MQSNWRGFLPGDSVVMLPAHHAPRLSEEASPVVILLEDEAEYNEIASGEGHLFEFFEKMLSSIGLNLDNCRIEGFWEESAINGSCCLIFSGNHQRTAPSQVFGFPKVSQIMNSADAKKSAWKLLKEVRARLEGSQS